jgi:hypothetical protein
MPSSKSKSGSVSGSSYSSNNSTNGTSKRERERTPRKKTQRKARRRDISSNAGKSVKPSQLRDSMVHPSNARLSLQSHAFRNMPFNKLETLINANDYWFSLVKNNLYDIIEHHKLVPPNLLNDTKFLDSTYILPFKTDEIELDKEELLHVIKVLNQYSDLNIPNMNPKELFKLYKDKQLLPTLAYAVSVNKILQPIIKDNDTKIRQNNIRLDELLRMGLKDNGNRQNSIDDKLYNMLHDERIYPLITAKIS